MKLRGSDTTTTLLKAGRITLLVAFMLPYLALTVAIAQRDSSANAIGTGHEEIRAASHHFVWNIRPSTVMRRHLPLTVPFLTDKEVECLCIIDIPSYRCDHNLFDTCSGFHSLAEGFFHSLPDRAPPLVA